MNSNSTDKHKSKSIGRVLRQLVYLPPVQAGWLNAQVKNELTKKVFEAEQGHRGEVYLVIENRLPVWRAFQLSPYQRALELFATCGVWDTQENTGILVYVNLCEHELHIVADRGIDAHVKQTSWQAMCDRALAKMGAGKPAAGLIALFDEIGALLRQFNTLQDDYPGNELDNRMLHIK